MEPGTRSTSRLEQRVIALVGEMVTQDASDIDGSTSLIQSGLIDSIALVELFTFIEGEVGEPIDVMSFDLAAEWDTADRIARFIESHRQYAAVT